MTTATTPQGIVTRNLMPLFEEQKGLESQTNWLAFAGRGGGVSRYENDVNEVEYEIVRGHRQMAKLVKRSGVTNRLLGTDQKNLGLGEFTQVSRAFPLSIEEYDIQSSKLTDKIPGEPNTDSGFTRQDRMIYWAAKGQTTMLAKQVRMMNYLCGQGIIEGVQDAIIGTSDTDLQYDFYRRATHLKTLTTPWSTHATATPLKDIDLGVDLNIQDGAKKSNIMLAGDTAWSDFLQCAELEVYSTYSDFKAFVPAGDARLSMPSEMNFLTENGWDFQGVVKTWKGRTVHVFTSEELVEVTAGTPQRSMPSKKVVICGPDSRLDQVYGPPETFPEDEMVIQQYRAWFGFEPGMAPAGEPNLVNGMIRPEMFCIDAYENKYRTLRTIRSQCAPIYVPVETDTWYTIVNASA
jgi:hypothetical protein